MPHQDRRPAPQLHPRDPFVLDTHELGRRPGSMRRRSWTLTAPAGGLGLEVIGVPEGAELELDVRLEAVMEGVLVSGEVRAPLAGECVRCLDRIDDTIVTGFQELFTYPESETSEDDAYRLEGDLADLEPVVTDAVVLALPLSPVCREDCPGLCSECGARLADDPAHRHEVTDPRWARLRELSFDESAGTDGAGGKQES